MTCPVRKVCWSPRSKVNISCNKNTAAHEPNPTFQHRDATETMRLFMVSMWMFAPLSISVSANVRINTGNPGKMPFVAHNNTNPQKILHKKKCHESPIAMHEWSLYRKDISADVSYSGI